MTPLSSLFLPDLLERAREPETLDWRPFRSGIEIYAIYGDPRAGSSAALLRYQPGAKLPAHIHTGYEHILILSGAQSDDNGTYRAGALVIHPPGSTHAIDCPEGCVALLIWEKPVCFTPAGQP
jgi:anti-sigma factor ChrR (cupin superfamily)